MTINKKRRKSRQRDRLLQIIQSSSSHPIAQWLYEQLKKDFPLVNIANVYRNLAILIEEEEIIDRDFGDGIVHYDGITTRHYHFICEKCDSITDFPMGIQEDISNLASLLSSNKVTGHTINFYGICEDCLKKHN